MYGYYESNIFNLTEIYYIRYGCYLRPQKVQAWLSFFALPVGIMLGRGLFLESPETFRLYFGWHNCLCIFKTKASRGTKLCRYFLFLFLLQHMKDQLYRTSRSQFYEWLFGTEKFSGFSRNGPQARAVIGWRSHRWFNTNNRANPDCNSSYSSKGPVKKRREHSKFDKLKFATSLSRPWSIFVLCLSWTFDRRQVSTGLGT